MRPGGNVIRHADRAHITNTPQRHEPLAVLRRLFGPGLVQLARRTREGREMLCNQRKRFGFVELARDNQHHVVRLVKLFVERL